MAVGRPLFLSWPPLSGNTRASPTKFDLPGGVLKSESFLVFIVLDVLATSKEPIG